MTTKHTSIPTTKHTPTLAKGSAADAQWLTVVSMNTLALAVGRIAELLEESTQREREWAQRRAKRHTKRSKAQKNAIATARAVRAMKRSAS